MRDNYCTNLSLYIWSHLLYILINSLESKVETRQPFVCCFICHTSSFVKLERKYPSTTRKKNWEKLVLNMLGVLVRASLIEGFDCVVGSLVKPTAINYTSSFYEFDLIILGVGACMCHKERFFIGSSDPFKFISQALPNHFKL